MDDVARAAGVGKRTIYVHFPSKEEVVLCHHRPDRRPAGRPAATTRPRPAGRPAGQGSGRCWSSGCCSGSTASATTRTGWTSCSPSLRPAYLARRGAVLRRRGRGVRRRARRPGTTAGEFDAPDPRGRRRGAPARHQQPAPVRPERPGAGPAEGRRGAGRPDRRPAPVRPVSLARRGGEAAARANAATPPRGSHAQEAPRAPPPADPFRRRLSRPAGSRPATGRDGPHPRRRRAEGRHRRRAGEGRRGLRLPGRGQEDGRGGPRPGRRRRSTTRSPAAGSWPRCSPKHLREVCKDKHLRVGFSAEPLPKDTDRGPSAEESASGCERIAALRNFGFKKVERLDGGGRAAGAGGVHAGRGDRRDGRRRHERSWRTPRR